MLSVRNGISASVMPPLKILVKSVHAGSKAISCQFNTHSARILGQLGNGGRSSVLSQVAPCRVHSECVFAETECFGVMNRPVRETARRTRRSSGLGVVWEGAAKLISAIMHTLCVEVVIEARAICRNTQ